MVQVEKSQDMEQYSEMLKKQVGMHQKENRDRIDELFGKVQELGEILENNEQKDEEQEARLDSIEQAVEALEQRENVGSNGFEIKNIEIAINKRIDQLQHSIAQNFETLEEQVIPALQKDTLEIVNRRLQTIRNRLFIMEQKVKTLPQDNK